MSDPLAAILDYHQATKHHFGRFAEGPGGLDWANQPNPFRRYPGAPLLALEHIPPDAEGPGYAPSFLEGRPSPAPRDRHGISRLLYDSLALSAWKQAGRSTWSLRVNPSSGNLHPTEGYLVCGPVAGLADTPMVAHYAPREHALERRAALPEATWRTLAAGLPEDALLLGLTSIHWRESWKYGQRAFRYCQHDVGHALAALAIAAAGLGWRTRLLDGWSRADLASLLGVAGQTGPEAEHPDCLLAVYPAEGTPRPTPPQDVSGHLADVQWQGEPNTLSPEHVAWQRVEQVAEASEKPATDGRYPAFTPPWPRLSVEDAPPALRGIVHRRRSAVAMDGRTGITANAFYQVLRKTLPGPDQVPFTALPWAPQVHLALFVHRVQDVEPGLYLLLRNPDHETDLRAGLRAEFEWQPPDGCPQDLPLYRLASGDARQLAGQLACLQDIAADGCFSLGMLARFEPALAAHGPWFYPRLYWESGVIGQVLYLEAYATGIAATGIGCFFDDAVHDVLGLQDNALQSLYHFTLGGALHDPRIMTLPAYPGPGGA